MGSSDRTLQENEDQEALKIWRSKKRYRDSSPEESADIQNADPANDNQGAAGQDVISESGPGADYRQIQWSPIDIEKQGNDTLKDIRRVRINSVSPELRGWYNQNNDIAAPKTNKAITEDDMSSLSATADVNPGIRKRFNLGSPANDNQQRIAGQDVISDKDSGAKQRTVQINNNQNAGNSSPNRNEPTGFRVGGIRLWGEPSEEEKDAFFKIMKHKVGELGAGFDLYRRCKEPIDKGFWFDAPRAVGKKLEEKINKLINN